MGEAGQRGLVCGLDGGTLAFVPQRIVTRVGGARLSERRIGFRELPCALGVGVADPTLGVVTRLGDTSLESPLDRKQFAEARARLAEE